MKVPISLAEAFGKPFEQLITQFATDQGLLPEPTAIDSPRFLARSVIPHVRKLSDLFNRVERTVEFRGPDLIRKEVSVATAEDGLDPYWKESSNPKNFRLAYFLYYMPSNLFRVASIWSELSRLGYRWPTPLPMRAIEFGAGPATGACGIAAGEHYAPVGLPKIGNWALIEQDRAMLELGNKWAELYFKECENPAWEIRPFKRKIEWDKPLLPPAAPKFTLWLMSYFLNENEEPPALLAKKLLEAWDKHLEKDGIVILVEPALKAQSRRLLEIRKHILEAKSEMQILLPCLGHQACGALAAPEDWCHEEVTWWRPPYFRHIDKMAGLDRKTLPFSYLVLTKSNKPRWEILPGLEQPRSTHRLVSPTHDEGKDLEFYVCGQNGKFKTRFRPEKKSPEAEINRGDILIDCEFSEPTHNPSPHNTDPDAEPEASPGLAHLLKRIRRFKTIK